MILQTGLYSDISADDYHNDSLTPEPALSSSGIKQLLSGSPAEFRALNRRLTDWREWAKKKATRAQDQGTIAHSLILGTPCDMISMRPEECPARTKKGEPYLTWSGDAKAWKEEQEANGAIFVDHDQRAGIQAAVASMESLLRKEFGDWPVGDSEQTVIWQRNTAHGLIWCRARFDHLALRFMVALDPKFTDLSLSDYSLARKIAAERWDIQAAWYVSGLAALGDPQLLAISAYLVFRFPVAELNPPYQARWVELPDWQYTAEADIEWACQTFARCLRSGEWPDYGGVYRPPCPSYLQVAAAERSTR
jgi:hypothetical protein